MDGNEQVIGTCSICGGQVTCPRVFWSVLLPKPTCRRCGAVEAESALPVIPMKRRSGRDALDSLPEKK